MDSTNLAESAKTKHFALAFPLKTYTGDATLIQDGSFDPRWSPLDLAKTDQCQIASDRIVSWLLWSLISSFFQ